ARCRIVPSAELLFGGARCPRLHFSPSLAATTCLRRATRWVARAVSRPAGWEALPRATTEGPEPGAARPGWTARPEWAAVEWAARPGWAAQGRAARGRAARGRASQPGWAPRAGRAAAGRPAVRPGW